MQESLQELVWRSDGCDTIWLCLDGETLSYMLFFMQLICVISLVSAKLISTWADGYW